MSEAEEEQKTPTKKPVKPIGGIGQYATIGGKHPAVQQSSNVDTQTSRSLESEESNMPAVQTAKPSNIKKSKHPEWEQQTIYLPPKLKMRLKVHAVEAKLEIS